MPRDTWLHLLAAAARHIDILVFSGTFLAQSNPRIADMLAERAGAGAGVKVRLCFGDADSQAVDIRDREEGFCGTLAHKIRASLTYYRGLPEIFGCEVRVHGATLYASIFRYDDNMFAKPTHVGGAGVGEPVAPPSPTRRQGLPAQLRRRLVDRIALGSEGELSAESA